MNEYGYIVISFLEIVKSINENEKKIVILLAASQHRDVAVKGFTFIDGTVRMKNSNKLVRHNYEALCRKVWESTLL